MRYTVCFLLFSCGSEFDYETGHGILVTDQTKSTSAAQVNAVVEALLDVIGGTGSRLSGVRLVIEADPLPMDGSDGACKHPAIGENGLPTGLCAEGLTWADQEYMRVWLRTPCLGATALVHELCHMFQWYRDDMFDYDHADAMWWRGETSADWLGTEAATLEECPND